MIHSTVVELQKHYQILSVIDLKNFFEDNGQKWLHDQLTLAHRAEYQSQQRIVVVYTEDKFDYTDLPGRALIFLQKSLASIDISNSFVTVVTGYHNIQQDLEQLQSLYSTDDYPMQHVMVDSDFSKINIVQDTKCHLAWNHLYISPNGDVLPCCVADQDFPLGNVNTATIKDIVSGTKYQQLRQNMLAGHRSKECHNCYQQEDQGLISHRHKSNNRWPSVDYQHYKPVYLDIRLSNTCNLKCRMCSGYYSSAIAQEDREIFNNSKWTESKIKKSTKFEILDQLNDYLEDIEKIYFAGGEPLLMPEHYALLDRLIESGNTDLELFYNTNFTVTKYKSNTVFDYWNQFKDVKIGASLDACDAVAEYVRHGCDWQEIENNVHQLQKQCPHVKFIVTSTVGFMNARSLIELQQRWHKSQTLLLQNFSLSVMLTPVHLTVSVLPAMHKQQLKEIIIDHINYCATNDAKTLASQWQNVVNYMMKNDHSYALPELKRLTAIMDQRREESFAAVFPEYQNLL